MKERFLAGLKNAAVMIIASLMLLGVVPLGMISHFSTANAEGEFLRLYPETEASLAAETALKNSDSFLIPENTHAVGEDRYGYLRFELGSLSEQKPDKISSASLRLVFLRTPTDEPVPVQLWLMPTDDWSGSMDWEEKPSRLGEIPLATMTLSPDESGAPQLFEVNLTDYVKKWIDEERKQVSFRIDSLGEGVTAIYAGSSYEDPVFRPCLKVVAGKATDPDEKTLQKISLTQKFATDQDKISMATVGDGNEIYLKFSLNDKNIQGAIYQANLKLKHLYKDPGAVLRVDRLENTDWTADGISSGDRPGGERYLVYREEDEENSTYDEISLTDVINGAYADGKNEVTIVLRSENGKIVFGLDGKHEPEMELAVSDDRDVMAAMETAAVILKENTKTNKITKSLFDDRIAENGVRTVVTWDATCRNTGESAEDTLAVTGKITRPKWFQESRELVAKVTISAGRYRTEEIHYLTVLPESIPKFEDAKFGTMLDIGTVSMEKKMNAESFEAIEGTRQVEGQKMTYRKMKRDSIVALNLSVEPEKQNYLTIKLWEEDAFTGIVISSLQDRSLKSFVLYEPQMAIREESGFCYLTYPIPSSYTRGREFVSLRLTAAEPEPLEVTEIEEQVALEEVAALPEAPETEEVPETEQLDGLEENPTATVYSAYITQTPYFDPMAFADQGEPVLKKNDAYTMVESVEHTTLFFGKEEQLLLNLPDGGTTAKIYRDTSYYNSYAEMAVKEYYNGELQTVDYGIYQIFRNRSEQELAIPWQEETIFGLYQDLEDGRYYKFLEKGQKIDDSVLPLGTEVEDGSNLMVQPGETTVLMLVAEPLYYPDYRVSELGGQAVADVKFTESVEVGSLTLRVMGTVPKREEKLMILCGVYDRGMLVGLETQRLTVSPGQVAAEILLDESILIKPGQTLKVYVENQQISCKAMSPVLELPQKQQTSEKKAS